MYMLKVSAEACVQICQEPVVIHCFKIYSEKFDTAVSSVHITANIYGIHFFPLQYLKSSAGFILGKENHEISGEANEVWATHTLKVCHLL